MSKWSEIYSCVVQTLSVLVTSQSRTSGFLKVCTCTLGQSPTQPFVNSTICQLYNLSTLPFANSTICKPYNLLTHPSVNPTICKVCKSLSPATLSSVPLPLLTLPICQPYHLSTLPAVNPTIYQPYLLSKRQKKMRWLLLRAIYHPPLRGAIYESALNKKIVCESF